MVRNAPILVKYGRPSIRAYQNRAMKFRNMAGAFVFWCLLVGCLLLAGQGCLGVSADDSMVVGEFMELSEYGSFSPEELCQSLCGECSCRGTLVRENLCQCSCDFAPDSAGGQNCTTQVRRLCEQMDVQCDFNGPEEDYVREPRGCHSMSCYEKHHEHDAGEYGGYHDGEGYGYDDEGHGHGAKQLICCKDKKEHKHKEKKHKFKKHKKLHDKHMKFHVVIKGKIPEPSCHEGHEGEGHYGGYDEHEGYRAAKPDKLPTNPAHAPMDVTVWTNRQKLAKKHPFRRPFHQHHHQPPPPPPHYAPAYPPPPYPAEPRGKSAAPPSSGPRPEPMPEPMHPPEDDHPPPPPQKPSAPPPPPPPPPQPELPPVTPFPERPLTPPPNLYDGAPVGPKKPPQEPPKIHKFSPPSPPPTPPPPPPSHFSRPSRPMVTVDPPTRRIESSRSFSKPSSYSSCDFDSYDLNYYYPPPSYHVPAPPPPPPPAPLSSYRSYSSSSYDPSYPSDHYHPHSHEYEHSKHYSAYDEPVEYSTYDDSPGDSREYYPDGHGVHPLSDNEIEDWPEFPPRSPSDIFIYNQIVSRQIIEADTARRYMAKPFQPTPRPLRDEFEPPTAEVGPVLYESFGEPEKNYEMYPAPTPPPDAFIPPVPPPAIPVEFPQPEHEPAMFTQNSEEALYPQPTPPPHYLLAKESGSMSSFGFEEYQHERPSHWEPSGYGRSAAGPSHYRGASSRSSSHHSRRYY